VSLLSEPVDRRGAWIVLGTLAVLVIVNVPELGSDVRVFQAGPFEPSGPFAWLVRAAGSEWDLGVLRAAALLAGVLVAVAAAVTLRVNAWRTDAMALLAALVLCLLLLPATFLQIGLRQSTEPWFFTNDSTYQIELAGDLILDGENPYGHDYTSSGLERFYSFDGTVGAETLEEQVALRHLAYFPGTPLSAAVWRLLPEPFDDYRLLVLLTTLGLAVAVFAFRAPAYLALAIGAALAGNPLAVHASWFGVADAPSILLLVLAMALVTRSRYVWAAVCLAVAALLKQFALVALPFVAVMLLTRGVDHRTLWRSAATYAAVFLAGLLPFLIADAGALWDDTIAYGADTYRIIGYGLSGILLEAGVIDERTDSYPFAFLAAFVWLPVTAWLVWTQLRARALWPGAVAFAVSIFTLLFLGRVLQNSYLVWPLAGIALACLLAAIESRGGDDRALSERGG
jgi:hypothetical protein